MTRTARGLIALSTIALLPAYFACGGNNSNLPPPPPATAATMLGMPPPPASSTTAVASAEPVDAGPPAPEPKLPAPALVLWSPSPDPPAPLPAIKITAPARDQVIPLDAADELDVMIDLRNWQTATGSQCVHIVLDNGSYRAMYDARAPIKLHDLVNADTPLTEGQHVLIAYPARANHEAVKTPGALAITEFYVGKKMANTVDISKPMLVYNRPKGQYNGDMAGHILVDFLVANATLADGGNAVTISVTGPGIEGEKTAVAQKLGLPFYLDNAQSGAYTFKLDLADKTGAPVAGPFNSAVRTIRVDRKAAADVIPGLSVPGLTDGGL